MKNEAKMPLAKLKDKIRKELPKYTPDHNMHMGHGYGLDLRSGIATEYFYIYVSPHTFTPYGEGKVVDLKNYWHDRLYPKTKTCAA